MHRILTILLLSTIMSKGYSQNFIEIKTKNSGEYHQQEVSAFSSTQFFTKEGSIKFSEIDSIRFYYEPSENTVLSLEKHNVSYIIQKRSVDEIEEIMGQKVKSKLDHVIMVSGDTLFGYIKQVRGKKLVYKDLQKSKAEKILYSDIKSYRRNGDIYENYDGMKRLEIKGELSLYSLVVTSSHSYGPYGFGGASGSSTYYYLKRSHENNVTFLSTEDIISFGISFGKTAKVYFQDCPKLVEMIKSGQMTRYNIPEIVNYYNSSCGTKISEISH